MGLFCCFYLLIVSGKVVAVSIILESFSLNHFFSGELPGEGCLLHTECGKVYSGSENGCCGILAFIKLVIFLIGSTIVDMSCLVVDSGLLCCDFVVVPSGLS